MAKICQIFHAIDTDEETLDTLKSEWEPSEEFIDEFPYSTVNYQTVSDWETCWEQYNVG